MPTDGAKPRLTVYGRGYCHLCDELIDGLRDLQRDFGFDFDVIDVDSEPSLEEIYGEWVPVLKHGERELCHYRLDASAVTAYLRQIS